MTKNNEKIMPNGIYVHIPFCKSKCAYCAFVSTPQLELQARYVDALVTEIRASERAAADTVYIGGGTPSCLYRGALTRIIDELHGKFDICDGAEITVEANPESCDSSFAAEIADCGVNRVSIGLQSSNDRILRGIGRIHTLSDFTVAVETLQKHGFYNISSDLILGLPDQDVSDAEKSLEIICDNCAHASVYALSVEENTPMFARGYVPDDDRVADLYDFAVNKLYTRGFARYEVSNFARPNMQSRHNIKYWQCMPYVGFGAAAHGYDGEYTRYKHSEDISAYIKNPVRENYALSERDRYNEYVMLALRTDNGIDISRFKSRFGYDFIDKNKEVLGKLADGGLICVNDERVTINFDKMFVMNGIIEQLMI